MAERVYEFDWLDVALWLLGQGLGAAAHLLLAVSLPLAVALGAGLATIAISLRRVFNPDNAELFHDPSSRALASLLGLVLITVGAFVALVGYLLLTILIGTAWRESLLWQWLGWPYLALPLLVLASGVALTWQGVRLRRRR